MSPTNMYLEARRIGYIFKREDLTPVKREGLFIEMLESVPHAEAKILLAIKDQRLDKIYPKITPELASKVARTKQQGTHSLNFICPNRTFVDGVKDDSFVDA